MCIFYSLDGQKIAIRLSESCRISQYNSDLSESCRISWADAVDLSSSFYSDELFSSDLEVLAVVKSQSVQLYHWYDLFRSADLRRPLSGLTI